ncbi:expressed unknown protein [Seminavis robusta]|uniref:Uncharacterized protein n=1 Tax=Seminavis robusta TaxID=568900 RepID=A0A9N8DGV1_9STRA|nr:expressed unknown protein [Seminavis robusta]|eukprot:Sro113_g056090.1 n/a (549) ;mRNA; f:68192-69838
MHIFCNLKEGIHSSSNNIHQQYWKTKVSHRDQDNNNKTPLDAFLETVKQPQNPSTLKSNNNFTCQLRKYPPTRYYNTTRTDNPPSFLKDSDYIFGKWPHMLLLPTTTQPSIKICIDQTEWWPKPKQKQHSDGTNPSILSIHRLWNDAPLVAATILYHYPETSYVVAVVNKVFLQCVYDKIPTSWKADYNNKRSLILLLDERMTTIAQATLRVLVDDRDWGRKGFRIHKLNNRKQQDPTREEIITILDDPRLFVYQGHVYISFISHDWAWEDQYISPIHFDFFLGSTFYFGTTIRASEIVTLGKGRNQALLYDSPDVSYTSTPEQQPQQQQQAKKPHLFTVSWVDPVTVIPVGDVHLPKQKRRRRLLELNNKKKKRKDPQAHGTNGLMVRLPTTTQNQNEPPQYLGVAHFHRPRSTEPSIFAWFGHHYTHFFYTIQRRKPSNNNNGTAEFQLTALSAEFVLPSVDSHGRAPQDVGWDPNAHIVQFISGMELLHRRSSMEEPEQEQLIMAYGINDCESAITTIPLQQVKDMLVPVVEVGKEIQDFLKPLE